MTYDLYAERDCCEPRLMFKNSCLEELSDFVEEADAAGAWPVGFEAVARPTAGNSRPLVFTDGWHPLDENVV